MKTTKLRSAHAVIKDNRVIVISGSRIIKTEVDGARVMFTNTRLESPRPKATVISTLAILERAA